MMVHRKSFMAVQRLVILIGALTVATVSGQSVEVPSSPRSRAVIRRVTPVLQKALRAMHLDLGAPILVRIFKEERELEVWIKQGARFELFRVYPICSFSGDLGPKRQLGDMQSPEGFYSVGPTMLNPSSHFHLSYNIGYPNAYDRAQGWTGGEIMVHGSCVSIGCYAMTDPGIEEIFTLGEAALRGGQAVFPVQIFPFRLTSEKLLLCQDSPWYDFWCNLKQGYDLFERHHRSLRVSVRDKKYVFQSNHQ